MVPCSLGLSSFLQLAPLSPCTTHPQPALKIVSCDPTRNRKEQVTLTLLLSPVIPTAQDRAPKDGQAPVHVGSNGAHSTASGVSANATDALAGTGETGGRMAHANQQREEGQFPKQVSESSSVAFLSVMSESGAGWPRTGASLVEKKCWRGLPELITACLLNRARPGAV